MTPTLSQLIDSKVASIGFTQLRTNLETWLESQGFVHHSLHFYNLEPSNLGFQAMIQLNPSNLVLTIRVKQPNTLTPYTIQYIEPLSYSDGFPSLTAQIWEKVAQHIVYCTH